MEDKKPIGYEALCWSCNFVWNISLLPPNATDVKCEKCGGQVVTASGKAQIRPIFDEFDSTAPLLEAVEKGKIILPGINDVETGKKFKLE